MITTATVEKRQMALGPALMRAARTRPTIGTTGDATGNSTRSARPRGTAVTNATLQPAMPEWEVGFQWNIEVFRLGTT